MEPFEKLNWYGKLKLRLWGGERYYLQDILEKIHRIARYLSHGSQLAKTVLICLQVEQRT